MEVYFGETKCTASYKSGPRKGKQCQNQAYYIAGSYYRCGVHSKKDSRKQLPKNPRAAEIKALKLKQHLESVEETAKKNGGRGKVISSKLRMYSTPPYVSGYMNVFPNNRHQNRKDGYGCASLSPMRLGPVIHGQPGLPKARNLENFHQGNKVFPSEVDSDNKPTKEFFQTQRAMYLDPKPHRHKKNATTGKKNGKNIPKYSVWIKKNGDPVKCSYIESRQFYCTFYQRLTEETTDLANLRSLLKQGYNLNIIGYDGYRVTQDLEKHYLDDSKPFGHELVLYSLLVCRPSEYPWLKHSNLIQN